MNRIFVGMMLGLVMGVTCAYSSETPMSDERYNSNVAIFPNGIAPAIGRFVLIRRGEELCAIKFTGVWRGNDAKAPTFFQSGEESFRAEYDWYYIPKYGGEWSRSKPQSGHSQVERKPLVGLGRFAFQTGKAEVDCGQIRLHWLDPTQLGFLGRGEKSGDPGYEIAPTKWKSVEEINPEASYLKWYRYDEKRPRQVIRIDDLW